MTVYSAESFLRATIRQSTASNQSVPYTLKVSKIPTLTNGLLTISPNTSNEEIVEYDGVDGAALTITVVKNGINPSAQLLTTNGVDYNNPLYIKAHSQNDVIRGDVNHIHINQGSSNSTLATNIGVGISKLSVAAADPGNPIVVGDNDQRLDKKFWSYFWNMTSGANLDATFRNIAAFGSDNDNEVAFTGTLITGLGSMTGTITNNSHSSSIVLGNGERCRISANTGSTNQFRIIRTGGFSRLLSGSIFDLSSSVSSVTFMNASASPMTISIQAADSGASRLVAGLLVEVF